MVYARNTVTVLLDAATMMPAATTSLTATAEVAGRVLAVHQRGRRLDLQLALLPPVTLRVEAHKLAWASKIGPGEWVEAAGEMAWLSGSAREATVIQAATVQIAWSRKPRLVWRLIGTVDEVAFGPRGATVLTSYERRGRRAQVEGAAQIETALRAASISGPAVIEGTIAIEPDMSIQYVIQQIEEVARSTTPG